MKKYKPFYHTESGITFKTFQQVREYIWENRDHVSEISGEPLLHENHPQWSWQFLHVLNRNHTFWVLNPDNVLLGTVAEHEHQEQYEVFINKRDELKEQYYREFNVNTMEL